MKQRVSVYAHRYCGLRIASSIALVCMLPVGDIGGFWARHTIDDASKGADGVRLADANGDGLADIVTGWEEGGVVRLCLNPGPAGAHRSWPAVTVGAARSVEDAVLIDLDGDRALDVVSACEGEERSLQIHWAPLGAHRLLDSGAWTTLPLPAAKGQTKWMFTVPMDIDQRKGLDLVVGSKEPGGVIGWFEAPEQPRDLAAWVWHPLRRAGWVMSLIAVDMDGDGDQDVLFSDRRGSRSGCYWLERPRDPSGAWIEHAIGAVGEEAMFIDYGDTDGEGPMDVVAAVKPGTILICSRGDLERRTWQERRLAWPSQAGRPKAVALGDIDGDGRSDVVGSCEGAAGRVGVFWLELTPAGAAGPEDFHDISGPQGTKFDLVRLIDLDGDRDLDVVTCEETENLGVIWYENPLN